MHVRLLNKCHWCRVCLASLLLLARSACSSHLPYEAPLALEVLADRRTLEQRQGHRKLTRVADSRVQLEVNSQHEHTHGDEHGDGVMPHVKLHIDFSHIPFWEKHFSAADLVHWDQFVECLILEHVGEEVEVSRKQVNTYSLSKGRWKKHLPLKIGWSGTEPTRVPHLPDP